VSRFFAVLEPIGENAERERLCSGDGFIARLPVDEHVRQLGNFTDPTPSVSRSRSTVKSLMRQC
jgi:hypothetical protein